MRLKIAIQKSGRLYEESVQLLKDSGLKIDKAKGQLKASVRGFDAEVLFLRNSDIPKYLEDGIVDFAIIGQNTLKEKKAQVKVLDKLGFSKCRLSIATPKGYNYRDINDLNGKKIATSYPNTLNLFLKQNKINAEIHTISGSVEIAPNIGLADGICDIVSTGSTLFKNGLRETQVILTSEAVLAKSSKLTNQQNEIFEKLLFRIQAVLRAKNAKYVLMNLPDSKIEEVSKILPVLKSPTVLPLAKEGWSSLHSVIDEEKFWDVIDELKNAGAEGILVVPINKMIL